MRENPSMEIHARKSKPLPRHSAHEKTAEKALVSTLSCGFNMCNCSCPDALRPPGYQFRGFQRKRGRRSLGPLALEIFTSPASLKISSDTLVSRPDFSSSCRDTSCRVPASWNDPRTALHHLDAEQCDPRPLPVLQCLSSDTPDKAGGAPRTSCSRVSILRCSLLPLRTLSPLGAGSCVPRSTSARVARGSDTPDVCRGPLVCMACPSPSLPITKAPEVFPSRLPSSYLADSTIS